MNELATLTEWIKVLGSGGLIFLVWYLYHKAVTNQFTQILANQDKRATENFELLKDMVSSNLLQNEKLERIETKIDDHRWCPYFKRILQGDINNE